MQFSWHPIIQPSCHAFVSFAITFVPVVRLFHNWQQNFNNPPLRDYSSILNPFKEFSVCSNLLLFKWTRQTTYNGNWHSCKNQNHLKYHMLLYLLTADIQWVQDLQSLQIILIITIQYLISNVYALSILILEEFSWILVNQDVSIG